MNHFHYRDGVLSAEEVSLAALAQSVGTPFYCYSTATLERHYRVFSEALPKDSLIAFSVKANGNLAVLKTLAKLGAGADVVSGGELKKALAAGIAAEKIVFSGVGKTRAEMAFALEAGIHQFNVESEPELEALNDIALARNVTAPITLPWRQARRPSLMRPRGRSSSNSIGSISILRLSSFSRSPIRRVSLGATSVTARPEAPARPVRPTRCT